MLFCLLLFECMVSVIAKRCSGINKRIRSFDGSCNNLRKEDYGSTDSALLRKSPAAYPDDHASIVNDRPNSRYISNIIFAQDSNIINNIYATDFLWQWGQFLDHDM